MRFDLHDDADLSPLVRRQNLLPDEIGEPVVLVLFIGSDGKIGLHSDKRDFVGSNLRGELPLVERQIPIFAVKNDITSPSNWIFKSNIVEVLGQPPLQPLIGKVEVQHATDN